MGDAGTRVEERQDGVTLIRNVRIPMPDGVRLAANLYRPAGQGPWPAVFTYFPYRKDGPGGMGHVDVEHRYFAEHGYACLTVDVRGTGGSEGVSTSPNHELEPDDGYHVTEWIAAQPWCTGSVGLWGASYGGVSTLSVAATKPPHLKAIAPIHGSADEFDGFFRPHGCRPGFWTESDWGPRMVAMNLLPPLYRDREGLSMRLWLERLRDYEPWIFSWHRTDSETIWEERRTVVEEIEAATFAICGWQDYYPGVTLRYFNRIEAPKRVLIGPWKHTMPDRSPDHAIGGMHEMLRWWDRWLRGSENGVDQEPPVAVYVVGADVWQFEHSWPPQDAKATDWYLLPGGKLGTREDGAGTPPGCDTYAVDPTVGAASMLWDPLTPHIPYGPDHRPDDDRSLSYTTAPLTEALEVAGDPVAVLAVAADAEDSLLTIGVCAVGDDGSSTLLARGWVQLSRAAGVTELEPGRVYDVEIPVDAVRARIPAGHRLRLTVAGADFPRLWPTPNRVNLSLDRGRSHLRLPIVPERRDVATPVWRDPEPGGPAAAVLQPLDRWAVERDIVRRDLTITNESEGVYALDQETMLRIEHYATMRVSADEPEWASMASRMAARVEWPDQTVRVRAETLQTTDLLSASAQIEVDGTQVYAGRWRMPLRQDGFAPVEDRGGSGDLLIVDPPDSRGSRRLSPD